MGQEDQSNVALTGGRSCDYHMMCVYHPPSLRCPNMAVQAADEDEHDTDIELEVASVVSHVTCHVIIT